MMPSFIHSAFAAIALLGSASVGFSQPAQANQDPPNFVFILVDDVSPDDLSVYGNDFVQTPNLEKMAADGLVFDNAYLTISSCSPSRCSIITGRYPHNTGAPELHTSLPTDQTTFVQVLQRAGYHTIISGKNHMGNWKDLGFDVSSDSRPAGAEKWVQHLKDRPEDQPFFAWFASHDAHFGFTINDRAPTYDPDEIEVPPMLYDGAGTREALTGYFHEVSRTDHYVGQVMDELKRQGIADNTYVVYCSDNGRPFPRCKTFLYESGIQTPLVVTGPDVVQGRTESLASSIDLAPTFLQLAGVDRPESLQGVSLVPVLEDADEAVRDVAFAERNWHVFQNHQRAVRTGPWLYIWNAWPERYAVSMESSSYQFAAVKELWDAAERGELTDAQALLTLPKQPEEMLFHVEDDPYQFHNLADHAEHQATMKEMKSLLERWVEETGDSVPTDPTGDRQPIHDNGPRNMRRGEMPGAAHQATQINAAGPIWRETR